MAGPDPAPASASRAAVGASLADAERAAGLEPTAAVCAGGRYRCFAHARAEASGGRFRTFAAPVGLGPADLASAYGIDASANPGATIAIVDAYGYPTLERDLAAYRSAFGLPPCTVASGCLRIVNQRGQAAPLPPPAPAGNHWSIEAALDVDMASAACPRCKLLVVLADDDQGDGLFVGNTTAARLGATVISDSWGGPEQVGQSLASTDAHLNHPGVAIFVSSGDNGYNDGGQGPDYPATSPYVIAVGGTTLTRAAGGRGWSERAWSHGGSACSLSSPRPSYQPSTPCAHRVSADVAAVGDPQTGVAVYHAGEWSVIGGTSAAAPLVAGLFAAAGRGHVGPDFLYANASKFFDVSAGANGTCGNILCTAAPGWDGPTGVGTPSFTALRDGTGSATGNGPALAVTSPAHGAGVQPGFTIAASVAPSATRVEFLLDGAVLATATAPPYSHQTSPTVPLGDHVVEVRAYDAGGQVSAQEVAVRVSLDGASPPGAFDGDEVTGGCAAGHGSATGAVALLGVGLGLRLRRPRRRRPARPAA